MLQKEKKKRPQQPEEEPSEPEGREEELSTNQKLEKLRDFFSGCPAHQVDAAYALFCSNQNGDYNVDSSGRGDGSSKEEFRGDIAGDDAPPGAK